MISRVQIKRLLVPVIGFCLAAAAGPNPPHDFYSMYRHGHYFLVWNSTDESPNIELKCVGIGRYTDVLSYQVIDADSRPLVEEQMARDTSCRMGRLPLSRLYLVQADPGLNGVLFSVDRPYGIVASERRRLGLNKPRGRLFFYVPPTCGRFRIVAQSNSPREGGRVEVCAPDGSIAGTVDGELDEPTVVDVSVPAERRGRVWSLAFKKPTTPGVYLDDLNVHLEGDLPHLVVPRLEWARDLIPKLPKSK